MKGKNTVDNNCYISIPLFTVATLCALVHCLSIDILAVCMGSGHMPHSYIQLQLHF